MATADSTPNALSAPLPVRFEVRGSVLMELIWAVYLMPDEPALEFPARAARFAHSPGVEDRIRGFWGDGEPCFTEVFVAAERGGVLFEQNPERLWAGLAAGVVAPARFESLVSETPEDQDRFRSRLVRLHDEADLRDRWLQLLRDVWAAIEPDWNDHGRNVAEALVWAFRDRVPDVGTYADLLPLTQGCDFGGHLPRLVAESAVASQQVVLMPAWLCRRGFLISLSGWLLWGPPNPVLAAGPSEETRTRARRHKALGDPTRLAIFEAVARRPRTVGELAGEFGLAQPTVSNHVRMLREANLLMEQRKGEGRRLAADVASFERYLEESRRAVAGPAQVLQV